MVKKSQNVIVSLDTHNYKITIFENMGTDYGKVNIEEFYCETELIEKKKLYDILDNVFSAYFDDKTIITPDLYIVLPDYFVSTEHIKLPILPTAKMKDALRSELKKLYPNISDLAINSNVLFKTKKNVTYSCTMIKKYLISDCQNIAKKYNLNLRNITYHSNAVANAVQNLASKFKHTSHIFLDIAETQTHMLYANKNKLLCCQTLPFGYNLLSSKRLVSEFEMSMSRGAEKIVYLAKQKAREKNLSTLEIDSEENKNIQLEHFLKGLRKNKIALGRFIRKGDSEEADFLQQNFKTFEKYILLMKNSVVKNYGFPEPENIIINLPIEMENLDTSERIVDNMKVKFFSNEVPSNFSIFDYLELYGALFYSSYNKGGNFLG